jgi:hypothetical protein
VEKHSMTARGSEQEAPFADGYLPLLHREEPYSLWEMGEANPSAKNDQFYVVSNTRAKIRQVLKDPLVGKE